MLFLVRDGAAPNHPVMGIGAISSAAVQLDARDRFIGWLGDDVLSECQQNPNPEHADWAFTTVDKALKAIYRQDFLEKGILPAKLPKHVPQGIINKLRKLAERERDDHYSHAEVGLNKAGGDAAGALGRPSWRTAMKNSELLTTKGHNLPPIEKQRQYVLRCLVQKTRAPIADMR